MIFVISYKINVKKLIANIKMVENKTMILFNNYNDPFNTHSVAINNTRLRLNQYLEA